MTSHDQTNSHGFINKRFGVEECWSNINYSLLSPYIYRTITTSVSEDVANIGMVSDGTKCAQSKICMNHQCVDMSPSDITSCPRGDNNITCSGHGVSTKGNYSEW